MADFWQRHGERGLEKMLAPEEREACRASPDPGPLPGQALRRQRGAGQGFRHRRARSPAAARHRREPRRSRQARIRLYARTRRPSCCTRAARPPVHQRRAGLRRRLRRPGEAMNTMSLGPLMIDVAGLELSDLERGAPGPSAGGGVILFASAITAIRSSSRRCAPPSMPCAARRCRSPSTTRAGACSAAAKASLMCRRCVAWATCGIAIPAAARKAAADIGYLLAAELRACGVDLSFTPVLDLDWGPSGVIGDRAFHKDPLAVSELAGALIDGLRRRRHGLLRQALPRPRLGRCRFAPGDSGRRAQPGGNGARPRTLPPPAARRRDAGARDLPAGR
jgi:hypothetical protein